MGVYAEWASGAVVGVAAVVVVIIVHRALGGDGAAPRVKLSSPSPGFRWEREALEVDNCVAPSQWLTGPSPG